MAFLGIVSVAVLVVLISILWKVLLDVVWRPYAMTKAFRKQGLRGPACKFWSGSIEEMHRIKKDAKDLILDNRSHDITVRVLRDQQQWMEQYGRMYVFWLRTQPNIFVSDPEMVTQILSNKFGFFMKPEQNPNMLALLGNGLLFIGGPDWARHRRIVNPAFAVDKLKMLTKEMTGCTKLMLDEWQAQILREDNQQKEIEVGKQFKELTGDVISHSAFGSSYMEGKEIFLVQQKLHVLAVQAVFKIDFPGYRYLPTKGNLNTWKLEKTLRNNLKGIIEGRLQSKDHTYGNDLLGLMIQANEEQDGPKMNMDEVIDECKTFFFAGHESTSHFITWIMFLLSSYPDWQEKLRKEVLRECAMEIPKADMINKLKLVNMFLLETLRLYCPVPLIARQATSDMTLGNINVPKGTVLHIPIAIIHRIKDIWGDDANDFNPLRFEKGMSKASKHPNALLGFSIGPRACIGQNFAMMEAKTVIAMILQRFSFSLSESYKHAPLHLTTLEPEYGLPIVFRPLRS